MSIQEKDLIEKLLPNHPELKTMVEEHQTFKDQLEAMANRPYLSPEEDIERKKIQKAKLAIKDKIHQYLAAHNG